MSRAADLAQYMVRASTLHPAFQHSSMLYNMEMGGWEDPTTQVRSSHLQLQDCTSCWRSVALLVLFTARLVVLGQVCNDG